MIRFLSSVQGHTSRRCVCLLLLFLCAIRAEGKVEVIDGKDGLSNSTITAILKDPYGIMWIGTRNGLNIYDGYSFSRPYSELGNLSVSRLVYDKKRNSVWVGTDRGLYLVACDNGAVRAAGGAAQSNFVADVLVTAEDVFVAYRNGTIARSGSDLQVRPITRLEPADDDSRYAWNLAPDTDSSILFCNEQGLFRLMLRTGEIRLLPVPGSVHRPLFLKRAGKLLVVSTTWNGLQLLNAENFTDRTPPELRRLNTQKKTGAFAVVRDNDLYIVYRDTFAGMPHVYNDLYYYKYDLHTGRFRKLYAGSIRGGKWENCIFMDGDGIIWLGTNRGIYKITEERQQFGQMLKDRVPQVSVKSLLEDDNGDIYAGSYTNFALYHFSRKEKKWNVYHDARSGRRMSGPYALLKDTGTYIYMASEPFPLCRFNKKTRQIETSFVDQSALKNIKRGNALCRDEEGVIWVGTDNGLLSYHPAENRLTRHRGDAFDIGNTVVRSMMKDRDGNLLWVATDNGLYCIHRKKGLLRRLHTGSAPALTTNDIFFVSQDDAGRLWLGTNGGGIHIVAGNLDTVQHLNKARNGLAHDIVYGMLRDGKGRYWISTFHGLSCYIPERNRFANFFNSDGLNDDEFNQSSLCRGRDGKMYFGSVNGITAFYPDSMTVDNVTAPRLFISPLSHWNNESREFTAMYQLRGAGEKIVFYSPSSSLMLNIGLTDYTDPKGNAISYRVRGLFDEWILMESPILRLNGIPYGKYTVEIRGMNASGTPAANRLHFGLQVKKPFYNTWWFYALLLLLGGTLLYLFFFIRYRNLKQMQQLRIQIASDLHDEVGGLLTRITLFSDNIRSGRNSGREKELKLEKIAELSRDATATMSDILWAIDARNDFAGNLTDRMREYAGEMLFPLDVEIVFQASGMQGKEKVSSRVRQQLYLVFKEAVNNVARHARAGFVEITWQYDHEQFMLRIRNDGAVCDPGSPATGQGLKNMAMRAAAIGARMEHSCSGGIFCVVVTKT